MSYDDKDLAAILEEQEREERDATQEKQRQLNDRLIAHRMTTANALKAAGISVNIRPIVLNQWRRTYRFDVRYAHREAVFFPDRDKEYTHGPSWYAVGSLRRGKGIRSLIEALKWGLYVKGPHGATAESIGV